MLSPIFKFKKNHKFSEGLKYTFSPAFPTASIIVEFRGLRIYLEKGIKAQGTRVVAKEVQSIEVQSEKTSEK